MRGYLDTAEANFRSWLLRLTSARGQVLDEAALLASARLGIAEGLLAGITTYADTSSSPAVVRALASMRVRGISYQEVFGPHPSQCAAAIAELRERVAALMPLKTSLVKLGVSPHAPYTVSDDLYRAVAEYATAANLPVAAHIAESRVETDFVTQARGPFAEGWSARGIAVTPRAASCIRLLEATGILATRPLLIHCVHLTSEDVAVIARFGCSVVHCPAANAKLGHGVAPVGRLLESLPVGVGSDSVASNNRMDMLDEVRMAILIARAARLAESDSLDAQQGIRLATIGGATALGLEREVGSLEPGKAADLAAFPVDSARDEPVYNPATALVFGAGGRRASLVAVAGVELVRDGRLIANLESDIAALRVAGTRLAQIALETPTLGALDFRVVPQA